MQSPGDVITVKRAVKQLALKNNHTIQPYIIIVGRLKKIKEVYVCVDETLYTVESVLEGIKICFQAFFVFHLEYPIDSRHLWLLIQKGIYGINTKNDAKISLIEFVTSEVINILNQANESSNQDEAPLATVCDLTNTLTETCASESESNLSINSKTEKTPDKKNHKRKKSPEPTKKKI